MVLMKKMMKDYNSFIDSEVTEAYLTNFLIFIFFAFLFIYSNIAILFFISPAFIIFAIYNLHKMKIFYKHRVL